MLIGDITVTGGAVRRLVAASINSSGETLIDARFGREGRGLFRNGLDLVVREGASVPGVTGTLDRISDPVLSDTGVTYFYGRLASPLVSLNLPIDEGFFRCTGGDGDCDTGSGTLEALVLRGDAVVDIPGRELCSFEPQFDASDWGITFIAATRIDCTSGFEFPLIGVFRLAHGGTVETVAIQTQFANPSPNPFGTTYERFDGRPVIEDDGVVAFLARIDGANFDEVIYSCDPATCPAAPADIAAAEGMLDPQSNFLSKFAAIDISDDADISFFAKGKPSAGGMKGKGVYVYRSAGATLERAAIRGDLTGGMDPQETFLKVLLPGMSAGGRVAFQAKVKGSGTARTVIYLYE